jgi:transposase
MQNKSTKNLDFSGHNIYVGLDVHAKTWAVNIIVDDIEFKRFTQPPDPVALSNFLSKHFPGANYFSAYESGFCGYHHHRKLIELCIQNMVINAADLPITNKEKIGKRDPVDSRRLSQALKNNQLSGIYVFNPDHEQFRSLFRMRWRAVKDHRRIKNRIWSFLYYYGINPPSELNPNFWPQSFILWLENLSLSNQTGTFALKYLLTAYHQTRDILLDLTKKLHNCVKTYYSDDYAILQSIPGVGPLTAMCLIAEIHNIRRFKSCKHLASYVGLIPRSHQSGDKDPDSSLTYRSNKYLRAAIVEAAWVAIRHDPELLLCYRQHAFRCKPQVAIVKVAHKLLNKIRFVWMNGVPYKVVD